MVAVYKFVLIKGHVAELDLSTVARTKFQIAFTYRKREVKTCIVVLVVGVLLLLGEFVESVVRKGQSYGCGEHVRGSGIHIRKHYFGVLFAELNVALIRTKLIGERATHAPISSELAKKVLSAKGQIVHGLVFQSGVVHII